MSEQRRADAQRRAELAMADAAAEARAAAEQLTAFVAELQRRGVAPEPLQAVLFSGRRVRCDQEGWYLNRARTVAVGPDGSYFTLVTAGTAWARFTGVRVLPGRPSLVIGRGARDGESGDLADFLSRALADYTGN